MDSISNIFCVQALLGSLWFGLQQLLDFFLSQERLGPKLLISEVILHLAHILCKKPINE